MKSLIKDALGEEYMKQQGPTEEQRVFTSPEDEELLRIVEQLKINIKIVGCGGGGSNTIMRLMESGVYGAELIAINTDAQHLLQIKAHKKILIGRRRTRGLGAGADPHLGEEAARESEEDLRNALMKADIVFVTAGMGGGTGTGSAAVVAQIAKEMGALVIAVVTLPFKAEGRMRMDNALWGLERIRNYADTTVVIPNDKLLEIVPRLPLNQAFKVADEILMTALKGLTEMITKPGLVNIDYADIKTVMTSGGVAMIGIGESDSPSGRVEEAVQEAINSPLIEADISDARGAIVRVVGDPQMSVMEAQLAADLIQRKINPNARIIWGASVDPSLENTIQVLVLLTGVKSPYFVERGGSIRAVQRAAGAVGLDADIDFIE